MVLNPQRQHEILKSLARQKTVHQYMQDIKVTHKDRTYKGKKVSDLNDDDKVIKFNHIISLPYAKQARAEGRAIHINKTNLERWDSVSTQILSALMKESFEDQDHCDASMRPYTMLMLAIATSIDALAVGVSLAMAGSVNIFSAVVLIGGVTFVLSFAGVKIGNVFGSRFEKKAQIAGGCILILLGVKILLEHLGILM